MSVLYSIVGASALGELFNCEERNLKVKAAAALILYAGYVFQVVSPLRLSPDVIVYLSMATSAAEGNGFLYQGGETHFPIGYPAILLILDYAGVGAPWAIVGLNCLFLATGLVASFYVLRCGLGLTKNDAASVCCLTLLCSVFINNVFMPLSDAVFFGLSMTCIMLLLWAHRRQHMKRWLGLASAATLIGMSVFVRTLGIALIPALVWACLPADFNFCSLLHAALENRRRWAILSVVACAAIVVGVVSVTHTTYFQGALRLYADGGSDAALAILNYRGKDWGELAANVRIVDMPAPVRVGLKCVGLLGLAASIFSIWLRRYRFGVVETYVLSVTLVILMWPYTDGRFWMPIIPLLMGLLVPLFREVVRRRPVLKYAAAGYLVWFVLAGVVSLASNTKVSLSSPQYEALDADTRHAVSRFWR